MIPTPQQLILIKGEPRSFEVEELEYINDETCRVKFKGNPQPYPYKVKLLIKYEKSWQSIILNSWLLYREP